MKIIILGAGRIGSSLADGLAREKNEVTLVDTDEKKLERIANRMDLRTVVGNGAHPEVLEKAGTDDADMLVALTQIDEVNIVACQVASSLFKTSKRIARVRTPAYHAHGSNFLEEDLKIIPISPEQIAARHIARLVRRPGTFQVLDFADGLAQLAAVRISPGAPAAGRSLDDLHESLPGIQLHVAAVYREHEALKLEPDLRLKAYDEIFVLALAEQLGAVVEKLRAQLTRMRHVIIAGGGNVGHGVAAELESACHVKIIEHNERRAEELSRRLEHAIVLTGDALDGNLLHDENVSDMDAFCALTDNEEVNILAAMQAKRMKAATTITLVNRPAYADLIERDIDITVSPQQATLSELLWQIRRGNVLAAHSLRRGHAEALETIARESAEVTGKSIGQLNLPDGIDLGALVRKVDSDAGEPGNEMILPNMDTVIRPGDHVILFVSDKKRLKVVERLFGVNALSF